MSEETKSSVLPIVIGAGVAVMVGVGVFAMLPQPKTPVANLAPTPKVEEAIISPAPDVATVAPIAPEPVIPLGPQFDTFRVDPDGSMVIAGRAEPGQIVDIMLAGQAIDRVTADATGSFVALPTAGPSDAPRRLMLLADPDGAQLASETSYIVAPIAASVVVAEPAPEIADLAPAVEIASAGASNAPDPGVAPALPQIDDVVTVPAVPVLPTVLQADANGVRVIQSSPSLSAPNVALDAITYDPQGDVQLAGRAVGDGAVQVYIDNEPLTISEVTKGGDWQIDLPDIDTGVYTLRIDEVDTEGAVVSRIETPFKREEASEVAAVLAEETGRDGFEVAVKTVQPGATLWAIAEETLGNGIFYVEVFEANADLIRDPNLIYPGQIFRMPEVTQ